MARLVDRVAWINMGQLGAALAALKESGVRDVVMAGQITPTNLFRMRMDRELVALLSRLRERNAELGDAVLKKMLTFEELARQSLGSEMPASTPSSPEAPADEAAPAEASAEAGAESKQNDGL